MTRSEQQPDSQRDPSDRWETATNRCAHCGGMLDEEARQTTACPNCGGPIGASPAGSQFLSYEDKTAVCLPYELEGLARAEAVDGWRLVDTIVSEAVPGMIEVHFRRPVHFPAKSAPTDDSPRRKKPSRARPEHKPPPTAKPASESWEGLTPSQLMWIASAFLMVFGIMWATDKFGIVGLVLAVWLLPQIFRSIRGASGKTKRKRKRRKR